MEFPEDHSHAFIVRFWLEPSEAQGERPHYRGMIEDVASGRRLYLKKLDHITGFIESYVPGLKEMLGK